MIESRYKNNGISATRKWEHPEIVFYISLLLGSLVFLPEYFYDGFELPKLCCVQIAVVLILLSWLIQAFRRRELRLTFPVIAIPLLLLFALALISIGWSYNRLLAVEQLYHSSALVAFLCFAYALYRGRAIKAPVYLVVFIGSGLALWALMLDYIVPLRQWVYPHFIEHGPGHTVDHYRLLTSNQGNPNFLLHVLILTTPLTLGAALFETSRKRLLFVALFAVQLTCFLNSQFRTGIAAVALALLCFVMVSLIFHRKGIGKVVLLIGAIVACFVFTGGQRMEIWKERITSLRSAESIDVYSRVVFWETGKAMIADDPLIGKGIGQFVIYYPKYKTAKHWEKFSLLPPEITMWSLIPKQAHNEYLQVAIEFGLLGLALFLAFWLLFFRASWRLLRAVPADFYLLLGLLAGIMGVLFSALFTFPLQTVTSGMLFWTAAGLLMTRCSGREIAVAWSGRWLPGVLILMTLVCLWFPVRIAHGEYLFFKALKIHALNLDDSIDINKQAAALLPWHFEIQYVGGWLALLKGDTVSANCYFRRSITDAPFFPPSHKYIKYSE